MLTTTYYLKLISTDSIAIDLIILYIVGYSMISIGHLQWWEPQTTVMFNLAAWYKSEDKIT